jgi:predicted RNase H-like HicB family nuclease
LCARIAATPAEEEMMASRTLQFVGTIWQEGDMYTAYCPELDLATCGHTVEEARHNLREAIEIFLEETAEMGTLQELLAEAGYSLDEVAQERARHLVAIAPLEVSLQVA